MKLQKLRWSRVYESSEEELIDLLNTKNIKSSRVHADELTDIYDSSFTQDTTWWCVDGSMTIDANGSTLSLQAGDFIIIPANCTFSATAGITGCTYYVT